MFSRNFIFRSEDSWWQRAYGETRKSLKLLQSDLNENLLGRPIGKYREKNNCTKGKGKETGNKKLMAFV